MSVHHKAIGLSPDMHDYLISRSYRPHPQLNELYEATFADARSSSASRMCSPFDGIAFLQMIVAINGTKKIIEVGTFTGFTALAMALALPEDGHLLTLDINNDYVDVGKPFWEKAGVSSKISTKFGPAVDSMNELITTDAGQYDLVFIDADKPNYDNYYEAALKLLRPGGLILVDNVLWGGSVIRMDDNSPSTVAIRELNEKIYNDKRVNVCMVPVSDGVTIARKL